jgi:hypothetical protein
MDSRDPTDQATTGSAERNRNSAICDSAAISVSSRASCGDRDVGIGAKENYGQLLARDGVSTPVDKEGGGPATSDVDEPRTLQPEFLFKTRQLHVPRVSRNGRDVNTVNMK